MMTIFSLFGFPPHTNTINFAETNIDTKSTKWIWLTCLNHKLLHPIPPIYPIPSVIYAYIPNGFLAPEDPLPPPPPPSLSFLFLPPISPAPCAGLGACASALSTGGVS